MTEKKQSPEARGGADRASGSTQEKFNKTSVNQPVLIERLTRMVETVSLLVIGLVLSDRILRDMSLPESMRNDVADSREYYIEVLKTWGLL